METVKVRRLRYGSWNDDTARFTYSELNIAPGDMFQEESSCSANNGEVPSSDLNIFALVYL